MAQSPEATKTAPNDPAAPRLSVAGAVRTAVEGLNYLEDNELAEDRDEVFKELARNIEFVQRNDASHPFLPYLSGRLNALTGARARAVADLQSFVDRPEGRTEWRAFRILGDLMVDSYPELARSYLDRADELKPGEPSVLFALARCELRRGRKKEAVEFARKAVEVDGSRSVTYMAYLAKTLGEEGNAEEADRIAGDALRRAQEIDRQYPGNQIAIATLESQYRLSIEILRGRIQAGQGGAADFIRLAGLLRSRAATSSRLIIFDVLNTLEAGIARLGDATPPELFQEFGIALAEAEKRDAAIAVFQKLLEVQPSNVVAKEWLERFGAPTSNDSAPSSRP